MEYRIFIVEDDRTIAGVLENHFSRWGMKAVTVKDFSDVMREFRRCDPHLVLMDITLPFYNGYYWCSQIRKASKVPVVFISSASDNMNIVMAVDMGGDDFVAKPFSLDVLGAKVRALLRRSYDFSVAMDSLECGGVVLNIADATAEVGGERIDLTKNEYRILHVLFENKGRMVSRDTLMQKLWETDSFVDENTLTVNIARLRRKLEEYGVGELIITKKGMGYMVKDDE